MARPSVVLAALTDIPTTTSEVYDRVGYLELARAGLIPYAKFRDELARLASTGLAEQTLAEDGSSLWRRPALPPAA